MDPAAESSEPARRTDSPEPNSTRPNPFDDTEAAARKRRRTSLSGSPSRSVNDSDSARNKSSVTPPSVEDEASDNAMHIDRRPTTPQTPEQQLVTEQHSPEPPSSRVTINLRKTPRDDTTIPLSLSAAGVVSFESDQQNQRMVRTSPSPSPSPNEMDQIEPGSRSSHTSTLSSQSPPVELIAVQDSEDDISLGPPIEEVSMDDQGRYLMDPTDDFPYQETHEHPYDTVQRLVHYITQNPLLDENIIQTTQRWLRDFLRYIRDADHIRVKNSLQMNKRLWATYPEIIHAMKIRKPPLHLEPEFRHIVLDFYQDFVQVTARFVTLDIDTLREFRQELIMRDEKRCPDLFSGSLLHYLYHLTRRGPMLEEDIGPYETQAEMPQLLRRLEACLGNSFEKLEELIGLLLGIVPTFPRLLGTLANATEVLANVLREAQRALLTDSLDRQQVAKLRLERGHHLWVDISNCLTELVNRHVTQLTTDSISSVTAALADILKTCLRGQHSMASELTEKHRQSHPALSSEWSSAAISLEWRFEVLGKLIRSSQMQLRVWAVTTMCTELIGVWRRFQDDPDHQMLKHLAGWLLQSTLIEYILGPNCHPEIIAESANIVGFLVVTKTYEQQHTDRLWYNVTCSQDPRVSDALVRMITTIINIFEQDHLLAFCDKFQGLAVDAFTASIRNLWTTIISQLMDKAQKEHTILTYQPYDLCMKLLRQSSMLGEVSQVAHPEMQCLVMQKFRDLLSYGPDNEGRTQLYVSCLDDVSKKTPTSLGSLWCLLISIRPVMEREVQVLTREYDLPRLIIDELNAAVDASRATLSSPTVLWGNSNQPRREFLLSIIQFQAETIDEALGKKLWDLLVGPLSPSANDRLAGWQILNEVVVRSASKNPFIRTCLAQHLPCLPPSCFCEGQLEFIKQEVMKLLDMNQNFQLDEEEVVKSSCLEHLWTIILTADEPVLAGQAIHFLIVDIYAAASVVAGLSSRRLHQAHSILVNRCFVQLKEAASHIQAADTIDDSGHDGEAMVIVQSDDHLRRHERVFTRSLQLLRYFLDVYQTRPDLSAPDLRALMSQVPSQIEGDPAQLKYQSFDGDRQTEVKPLSIGKRNTAASLLASLRMETGFQNYRAYYRGQPFQPDVRQICKSLEDLQVHEGLILVQRADENDGLGAQRVKIGASVLQIDILHHFDELWEYLDLKESLAQEIYHFLIRLPANYRIVESFEDETAFASDIFPSGHAFKSLYTVHALCEYKELCWQNNDRPRDGVGPQLFPRRTYEEARICSIALIVKALSDDTGLSQHSEAVQIRLAASLLHVLIRWLQGINPSESRHDAASFGISSPDVFISILNRAIASSEESSIHVLVNSLEAIMWLGLLDGGFWGSLVTNDDFARAIQSLLLNGRRSLRTMTVKKAKEFITRECSVGSSGTHRIAKFFWSSVSQLITDATLLPEQCHDLFELSNFLLRDAYQGWRQDIDFSALATQFSTLLLEHTSSEHIDQVDPLDPVAKYLVGHLLLCLQADESIARSGSLPERLGPELFWRHLFPRQRTAFEQPVANIILNSDTRSQLCSVIFILAKHDRAKFTQLLNDLTDLVPVFTTEDDDPYLYELPSSFDRFKALRAPCGYVGLRNLSNTCYLNSLLTQLYMNAPFRNFLLSSKVQDSDSSQQLLFQTQKLFGFMQESYRRFVDPSDVVASIRTYDDTPIDIHSQMDVDEFYNLLFDRWEGQLVNAAERRKLRSFFGGQLVQQVKSQECEHISERLEPFSAIQCDIKGKSSLEASLQAYVDGEILEGDNKYKCSTCDRHVDAVKRACLKDVPDNVIFHLKRFDFNLRTLQRSKINDYFTFPAKINLAPYTVEHISGLEVAEDIFELVGVLVHAGTAESGHYYSYIRERPTQDGRSDWVEFNDDNVSAWDPTLMEASTFGGANRAQPADPSGVIYDKPYSAYMLFYQRSSSLAKQAQDMPQHASPVPLHVPVDAEQKEHIFEENSQLLRRHCLYDPSHLNLVKESFLHARELTEGGPMGTDPTTAGNGTVDTRIPDQLINDLAMEMLLSHFDQVVCRTKDLPQLGEFSRAISTAITTSCQSALSLYDYFRTRPMALRSLIQRNPDPSVRLYAGNTLLLALRKIASDAPFLYDIPRLEDSSKDASQLLEIERARIAFWRSRGREPDQQDYVLHGALKIFRYLWKGFPVYIRAWDEFFKIILGFAKMGDKEVARLLADNWLLKLSRIIVADQTTELPNNYNRMVQNVQRRFTNRPPPYAAIIATIDYLLQQLTPDLGPDTIVDSALDRQDQCEAPFMWATEEVNLFHMHHGRYDVNLFAEKLIALDQFQGSTDRIIVRLIGTGEHMDMAIASTLRTNIRREDSSHATEPFLRMSIQYLENTASLQRASQLVTHVAKESRHMQITEAPAIVSFFRAALALKRPEEAVASQIHSLCITLIPDWVPCLLVHYDTSVRAAIAEILEFELFRFGPEYQADNEGGMSDDGREPMILTVQRLGVACLEYLRDAYVRRRAQIGRDQANIVSRVINHCGQAFENDGHPASDDLSVEFGLLRIDVIEQLRALVVDELEEEGSEWDASCVSSEQMDGIAEMSMQVMRDGNDPDMTRLS